MPVLCWKQQKDELSIILKTISLLGAEICLAHCIEQKSREDLRVSLVILQRGSCILKCIDSLRSE